MSKTLYEATIMQLKGRALEAYGTLEMLFKNPPRFSTGGMGRSLERNHIIVCERFIYILILEKIQ